MHFVRCVSFVLAVVSAANIMAKLIPPRIGPLKIKASSRVSVASSTSYAAESVDTEPTPSILPSVTVKLLLWIKDFLNFQLAFKAQAAPPQPSKVYLGSRIINYDKAFANEDDMRAWTRHLVNQPRIREPVKPKPRSSEVELHIEEFIDYLVKHKGFQASDLQFLKRPELDHGYDAIEEELSKIKRNQSQVSIIEIGGEENGLSRLRLSALVFLSALLSFI